MVNTARIYLAKLMLSYAAVIAPRGHVESKQYHVAGASGIKVRVFDASAEKRLRRRSVVKKAIDAFEASPATSAYQAFVGEQNRQAS